MDTALQDLKFVFRSLARRPGFTAAVLLMLGLGIGANTAIFSVVNGVLLDPLPFDDADRLVTPNVMSTQGFYISTSIPNYYHWKDQSRSFEAFGAYRGTNTVLTGLDRPDEAGVGRFFRGARCRCRNRPNDNRGRVRARRRQMTCACRWATSPKCSAGTRAEARQKLGPSAAFSRM